jgi:hypothetical protein
LIPWLTVAGPTQPRE